MNRVWSRATAAEGVLTGNLNSEISQAESAEATKANIDAPIKVDSTAAVDTACAVVNGMALNPGQPSGQQVFVCRQSDPNDVSTRKWALVNDDQATVAGDDAGTVPSCNETSHS